MEDGRGVVHDLVERQQAEVDRHDFDDRPHAVQRRTDSCADKRGFGKRSVTDTIGAELLKQPFTHRVASAVSADIFAHQKDARIAEERVADRLAHRFAISDLHFLCVRTHLGFRSEYAKRVRSSTSSQVPASAKATALSISDATSSSMRFIFASSKIPCVFRRL